MYFSAVISNISNDDKWCGLSANDADMVSDLKTFLCLVIEAKVKCILLVNLEDLI